MYDGFQLIIPRACISRQLEKDLPELAAHVSYHNGDVYNLTAKVDGIHIKLKKSSEVQLNGSLHCYHTGGDNSSLFTYKDLLEAINSLAQQFSFQPHQAIIQNIEIGVNIPIEKPEDLIDAAVIFYDRVATKKVLNKRRYYKEWAFTEYTVKLYKKADNLVRYEIRLLRKRQLDKLQLITLSDLTDYQKFRQCLSFLQSNANRFVFVPNDNGKLPLSAKINMAEWRNDSYWGRFTEKNRSTKSRRIDDINNIIRCYFLTDWSRILQDGIREQGNLMISPKDATISSLGLLWETVAGPKGTGNRLMDDSPIENENNSHILLSIQIHLMDAYVGWFLDVTIQTLSDTPLLPRGPPSLLPVLHRDICTLRSLSYSNSCMYVYDWVVTETYWASVAQPL